jgi:hypothetical protein
MIIPTLTVAGLHVPQAIGWICAPAACALALFGFGRKKKVPPAAALAADGIDEETLAIISAAVEVALRKPVRVRRIRFLQNDGTTPWSVTGRLNIMGSHLLTTWK